MKIKYKFTKKIDIIFWIVVVLLVIIDFAFNYQNIYNLFFKIFDIDIIRGVYIFYFALYNFIAFVIVLLLGLLHHFYLIIIYIAYKIAERKNNKEKEIIISKDDIKYYRDIISKYSPSVLGYIHDFKIEKKTKKILFYGMII